MRRLTVRTQLTLWFAVCLAVGVAVFGAGLYALFGRYLLGEVDRNLEEEIIEVVREVRDADPGELRGELVENFGGHGFYVIQVSDPDGRSLFATPPDAPPLPPPGVAPAGPPATVVVAGHDPHRLIVRSVRRPEGAYAVAVGDPLTLYHRVLGRLVIAIAILGPAAAGLALTGGYWLARRALAPVDRVTRAALSITASDMRRRVHADGTRDEVGRLAEAFNLMIERLETAFEETRRFTADAAHELRTPLAVLRTAAEVSLRSDDPRDHRRVLEGQLDEIDRLSRLADQLLFLCREDAGFPPEEIEPVRLDLLLEELCESLQPTAESGRVSLVCDDPPPCVIHAPPGRLRRLFLNLLDNALRYTPPGGRIDVRTAVGRDQASVSIEDDGPGIAPQHLPHVFERFYRGDASRNRATGGSGLGLAICKSIADSLGGEVRLEPRPAGGTAATVRLPIGNTSAAFPRADLRPTLVAPGIT